MKTEGDLYVKQMIWKGLLYVVGVSIGGFIGLVGYSYDREMKEMREKIHEGVVKFDMFEREHRQVRDEQLRRTSRIDLLEKRVEGLTRQVSRLERLPGSRYGREEDLK